MAQILSLKVRFLHFAHDVSQKKSIHLLKHVHTCVFLLQVLYFGCPERMALTIHWYLKYYPCYNDFSNIEVSKYISNHGNYVLKVIVKKKCLIAIHYLQEMYERTSEVHGESLEPNPLRHGEFIEHKHAPITCYDEMHSFPMLRVRL